MTLHINPSGNIELQQTVRELDVRITALENKHIVVSEETAQPKEAESGDQGSQPGQEG